MANTGAGPARAVAGRPVDRCCCEGVLPRQGGPRARRLDELAGETRTLVWSLDADRGIGRDQLGREVTLRPFLGVIGMPPPEPGIHPTHPPGRFGGNIDCSERVEGTTLYLPIPVDGGLVSAGDGHARQGDGEVSQLAIEAPMSESSR